MTAHLIKAGDSLPPFVRPTGLETWNRFAGVNEEYVPIHMDDEAGRAAGFPSAIGQGNLQWSYFHNLLREWLGRAGRIDRVSARFQEPNLKDTVVTAQGRVLQVEPSPEGLRVFVELWTVDNHDRRLAVGEAVVTVVS